MAPNPKQQHHCTFIVNKTLGQWYIYCTNVIDGANITQLIAVNTKQAAVGLTL
jgi:hypothetical protein